MSDTFHATSWKEVEERWEIIGKDFRRSFGNDFHRFAIEMLGMKVEQEHEHNNQLQEQLDVLHRSTFKAYSDIAILEEKLNALISIVRQASFPPGVFDKVHKLFESSRNEFFKSVKEEGDLPKGENN